MGRFREWVRSTSEIISDVKSILITISAIVAIVSWFLGSYVGYNYHKSQVVDFAKILKQHKHIAPEMDVVLNELAAKYDATWVGVYLIHNGTVYINDFHDLKIDRYMQSNYIDPFASERDNIVKDLPLKYMWEEFGSMIDCNHVYFDTRRGIGKTLRKYQFCDEWYYKSRNNIGTMIHSLMHDFKLKTMVCVPIYDANNVPFGFVAYEFQKHWDYDKRIVGSMIMDKIKIESIFKKWI